MRIEYDKEANAVYVYLSGDVSYGEAARTEELEEGVYLDKDRQGHALGLEFLDLSNFLAYLERHDGRIEVPGTKPGSATRAPGLSRV